MKIYDIHPIHSEKYTYFEVLPSVEVLMSKWHLLTSFAEPLKKTWQSLEIQISKKHPKRKRLDVLTIQDNLLVFPEAILRGELGDILKQHGELLPLHSEDGQFYLYHVTTVLDKVMDIENSYIMWHAQEGKPPEMSDVQMYEFFADGLSDAMIFKLPLHGTNRLQRRCFATEKFKLLVEKSGVTGLQFDLIWNGENPDYMNERYSHRPEIWERIKQTAKQELANKQYLPPAQPLPFPIVWREIPIYREYIRDSTYYKTEARKLLKSHGYMVKPSHSPLQIVEVIADLVEKLRFIPLPPLGAETDDSALLLSQLWAEQVCKQHGWHQGLVVHDDVYMGGAVISPDSIYFCYQLFFFQKFYNNHALENTIVQQFHNLGDPSKLPKKMDTQSLTPIGEVFNESMAKKNSSIQAVGLPSQ